MDPLAQQTIPDLALGQQSLHQEILSDRSLKLFLPTKQCAELQGAYDLIVH